MNTSTLSYFNIVDEQTINDERPFQLTSRTFTDINDAYSWMWSKAEDINECGYSAAVKETTYPASFLVVGAASERSRREVPSYLGFGALIVGETEHFYIVGVAAEHATWQAGRLASGLHYTSPPMATLEAAQAEALSLESQLYGAPITV